MKRGVCRECGCTDDDCSCCIKATGHPCHWIDYSHTLCSACHIHVHVKELKK
jgi:hypothetical protein